MAVIPASEARRESFSEGKILMSRWPDKPEWHQQEPEAKKWGGAGENSLDSKEAAD